MIKSCSGVVAALAVLFCCSQADAKPGAGSAGKAPEWVLYEELPEDGEIVSFNHAADGDGAFEICQSEDGYVGNVQQNSQGDSICDTKDGAKDSFYVLQLAEGADDGEAGGLAAKFREKQESVEPGQIEVGDLPPYMQFEFTEEERDEIDEAMEGTDAIQRMNEECAGADAPETCGPNMGS